MFRFSRLAPISGLLLALSALGALLPARPVAAQGYTVVSKSCDRCGGAVSVNAKVGDTCPHCGVTWGTERTTYQNRPAPAPSPAPTRPRARRQRLGEGSCSKCGRRVPADARVGDTCAYCGVYWSADDRRLIDEDEEDAEPARPAALPSLATSVAALKERRPAAQQVLPPALRRMDRTASRLVERLPLSAQEAYYTAIERFPALDSAARWRVFTAVQALSRVPESRWGELVSGAAASLRYVEQSPVRLRELRRDPAAALDRLRALAESWAEAPLQ